MTRHSRELTVAAALALLLLGLGIFAPAFFLPQRLLSQCTAEAPVLVLTIGVALIIIARQIDISIGSQFAVCAVLAGVVAKGGVPPVAAVLVAVGAGAAMGALNGVLVAWLRLPSIVVTLATLVFWQKGLRLWHPSQRVDVPPDQGWQWLGLSQMGGQWLVISIALGLLAAFAFASRHLAAGRFVYAVGSDAEAARLAGIAPRVVTFTLFVLMGALCGLAGAMNAIQSPAVDRDAGVGLELRAIAAAVVGGVAVSGGRGRLWGAALGLLLLGNINPALTHFHIAARWEKTVQGCVILLAVVADGVRARREGKSA